jgi:hypothetical protein
MPDFYTYVGSKAEVFRTLVNEVIRSCRATRTVRPSRDRPALQPRRHNSGEPMITRGCTTFRVVTSKRALDE